MDLASQSEMRIDFLETGLELKWCFFTKGIRSSIAKIVVDPKNKGKKLIDNLPTAHVIAIFVKPEFRGRHLAEKLLRIAQRGLKENGFIWLTLEAEEKITHHGKLINLYEKCDFEVFPVLDKYPLEYNDDECYRKVPMRCNLLKAQLDEESSEEAASTTTTTTSSTLTTNPSSAEFFYSISFVEELKRETLRLLSSLPLQLDIHQALQWIELNVFPGSLEHAFRTAGLLRARGHPDWMELAGFLRHLGRIQERWQEWQAPYMVDTHRAGRRSTSIDPDRDVVMEEEPVAKHGPLPRELTLEGQKVNLIEPEKYVKQGIDECVVNWSPNEFSYLCLNFAGRSSAPHELSQLLRYCYCDAWLDSNVNFEVEAYGDQEVKELVMQFRGILNEVDVKEKLNATQMEESMVRFLQLVEKYVSDVLVM